VTVLSGFLADARAVRRTVPSPNPRYAPIFAHDNPCERSVAILARSTATRGRPSVVPLDRAAAMPDFTRSRINSLSNSAMLAKIPNTSRPFGVLVSTPSCKLMKSIPSARNSSSALTR
jgi:hypothetical protein